MIPILAAAAILCRPEAEALVHHPLLGFSIIVALAPAEPIPEVLIIFVLLLTRLIDDSALLARLCVGP
jgi:hypothetical protein